MMTRREAPDAGAASLDALRPGGYRTPDLADREVAVLSELAREGEAWVAFQGLRRRLDLHQQALARTLARLAHAGLVARDGRGYRLTGDGVAALRGRALPRVAPDVLTVVQAVLPPQVTPEAVAAHLSRRWFRGLRWHAQSEGSGGTTLTWLTEPDGARVRVRIEGPSLALELEGPPGDSRRRFAAARALLLALAELYGLGEEDGRSLAFSAATPAAAAS